MSTIPESVWSHDRLVQYALETYGLAGVASACLLLQDKLDVDVTVMLYAMYLASCCGLVLDDEGLAAADRRVEKWRTEVVMPLRSVRKRLRPHAIGAPVRMLVKEAELTAELAAFALLAGDPVTVPSPGASGSAESLIRRVAEMSAMRSASDASFLDAEVADACALLQRVTDRP